MTLLLWQKQGCGSGRIRDFFSSWIRIRENILGRIRIREKISRIRNSGQHQVQSHYTFECPFAYIWMYFLPLKSWKILFWKYLCLLFIIILLKSLFLSGRAAVHHCMGAAPNGKDRGQRCHLGQPHHHNLESNPRKQELKVPPPGPGKWAPRI